jgi:hypothetical protein
MNTMSLSTSESCSDCSSSSAARRPCEGSPPEPRPRVAAGADLQPRRRERLIECLEVGVRGDEVDAAEPGSDHAVHGVAACSSHPDDLEASRCRAVELEFE